MVSTNAFKLLFQILKPIIFKKSRVILKQILTILNYSGKPIHTKRIWLLFSNLFQVSYKLA
jgi:hypothetical protein